MLRVLRFGTNITPERIVAAIASGVLEELERYGDEKFGRTARHIEEIGEAVATAQRVPTTREGRLAAEALKAWKSGQKTPVEYAEIQQTKKEVFQCTGN